MTKFEEHGFLSDETLQLKNKLRKDYAEWFEVLYLINGYCQNLQYKLNIDNQNSQQIVCAALYSRCLSMYQAALVVTMKGMDVQTRVLLRCVLESLFILVASSKSEDIAKEFVAADQLERRKFFNKATSWRADSLKELAANHATDEMKEKIAKDIEETGSKKIYTEQMAIKAGLHDWYLTAYSIFSQSVHSSIRDLEKHLIIDDQNKIIGLKNEPSNENIDRLFLTAAEAMLHALMAVEAVFNVKTEGFVDSTYKTIGKLSKSIER